MSLLLMNYARQGVRASVAPPPPTLPWIPNLPSGLTLLGDSFFGDIINGQFNAAGLGIDGTQAGVAVGQLRTDYNLTEANAPFTEDVFKYTYPAGSLGGGSGVVTLNTDVVNWQRMYTCFAMRLSDNYLIHSNQEKLWYPISNSVLGGGFASVLNIVAQSTGALDGAIGFALHPQTDRGTQYFASSTFPIVRGQWFTIEVYMQMNTATNTDAVCSVWVNGTQCLHITSNLNYGGGVASPKFVKPRLDSTRGGGNSTSPVPDGGMTRSFSRMAIYYSTTL